MMMMKEIAFPFPFRQHSILIVEPLPNRWSISFSVFFTFLNFFFSFFYFLLIFVLIFFFNQLVLSFLLVIYQVLFLSLVYLLVYCFIQNLQTIKCIVNSINSSFLFNFYLRHFSNEQKHYRDRFSLSIVDIGIAVSLTHFHL